MTDSLLQGLKGFLSDSAYAELSKMNTQMKGYLAQITAFAKENKEKNAEIARLTDENIVKSAEIARLTDESRVKSAEIARLQKENKSKTVENAEIRRKTLAKEVCSSFNCAAEPAKHTGELRSNCSIPLERTISQLQVVDHSAMITISPIGKKSELQYANMCKDIVRGNPIYWFDKKDNSTKVGDIFGLLHANRGVEICRVSRIDAHLHHDDPTWTYRNKLFLTNALCYIPWSDWEMFNWKGGQSCTQSISSKTSPRQKVQIMNYINTKIGQERLTQSLTISASENICQDIIMSSPSSSIGLEPLSDDDEEFTLVFNQKHNVWVDSDTNLCFTTKSTENGPIGQIQRGQLVKFLIRVGK